MGELLELNSRESSSGGAFFIMTSTVFFSYLDWFFLKLTLLSCVVIFDSISVWWYISQANNMQVTCTISVLVEQKSASSYHQLGDSMNIEPEESVYKYKRDKEKGKLSQS